jgi:formate dehydrogenase accessory protein FdhD
MLSSRVWRRNMSLAEPVHVDATHADSSVVSVSRLLREDGVTSETDDAVVAEVPVAMSFNDISYAVMMATPCDLEDFIRGFAIGEGIVTSPRAIYDIEIKPADTGVAVNARVSNETAHRLQSRRRSMAGPSGCGLCGIESIEQVTRDIAPLQSQALPSQVALDKALTDMRARQVVSQSTSGAHAAVWCDMEGNIVSVREDVGRHNALDKLIGWRSLNPTDGFVLVSSRASYEMVAKAATAGIGVLAAVSAPTSMAIDTAKSANLKLIAFASSGRHAVYA